MPDLDKLAKADKMLKQNSQDNGKEKSKSLNTFEMPSMAKNANKNEVPLKADLDLSLILRALLRVG